MYCSGTVGVPTLRIRSKATERSVRRTRAPVLPRKADSSAALASLRSGRNDKERVPRGLAKSAVVGQPRITMKRTKGGVFLVCFFFVISFITLATGLGFAQAEPGPEEGGNEVQVWAGGGHSVPGGTQHTEAFDL